ncbi:hypothetical protein TH47_13570 [Thalassospira sp. MCCC 1A02803]|nr:hypothetical protein TH47_13570 [Thalassospira sp. MCCC 1A02803]
MIAFGEFGDGPAQKTRWQKNCAARFEWGQACLVALGGNGNALVFKVL